MNIVKTQNTVVLNCLIAKTFWRRFCGLMGRKSIEPYEGMLFPHCRSIHTFFMRFSLDVVLLDRDAVVVDVIESFSPWRLLWPRSHVRHVLEMSAHCAKKHGIVQGTKMKIEGIV